MSKIKELHQLVSAKVEKVTGHRGERFSDNNFDRFAINVLELPPTLLKNVVSNDLIAVYEQKHAQGKYNKIPVGNSSQTKTLRQYTADRTFEVGTDNDIETLKIRNLGIWFTSYHYQQIVKQEKEKREKQTEKDDQINNRGYDKK